MTLICYEETINTLSIKGIDMHDEDIKHLELLAKFHYILAGITAVFSSIPLLHFIMGLLIISGKIFQESNTPVPPPFMGWMFVIVSSVFIMFGWCMAVFVFIGGRKLKQHKNRIFCMVVAGIECMFMPLGTILGVFTIILLNKESIKDIFAQTSAEGEGRR